MPSSKNGWTAKDLLPQIGKVALVTGSTRGLGYETALALAGAGATVIITGRNEDKGKKVMQKIRSLYPESSIDFGIMDQASLSSVARFSSDLSCKYDRLDILINNAAAAVANTKIGDKTEDGFEIHFGLNHLSHFALTAHLFPLLRKSSSPRVVTVSSGAYVVGRINFEDLQLDNSNRYTSMMAYSNSKLANILFANELQRRSEENQWGVRSIAVHPGLCRTDVLKNLKGIYGFYSNYLDGPFLSQSPATGASATLFAATAPEAEGGAFYTPSRMWKCKGPIVRSELESMAKDLADSAKLWEISLELTGAVWP